jgi:hypothetical protein
MLGGLFYGKAGLVQHSLTIWAWALRHWFQNYFLRDLHDVF